MSLRNKILAIHFFICIFCLSLTEVGTAESFPFRNREIGSSLPKIMLDEYRQHQKIGEGELKGKEFVIFFWGADTGVKKTRAIKAFEHIKPLISYLEKQKIPFYAVNIMNDSADVIDEVLRDAKMKLPVYYDAGRNLYGDFGLFVMPCILVADKNYKVAAGMGYTHNLSEVIIGEVEILHGSKSRAQVEAELNPEMVDKNDEEKSSKRHLNMGRTMFKRGMIESAIREFEKALEIEPNLAEAQIELGCLLVDGGKLKEGDDMLAKGLDLLPDDLQGQICSAQVLAKEGDLDTAMQDLQALLFRHARSPELHYSLGDVYVRKGQHEKAADEFKKAYDLLLRKEMME